MTNLIELLKQDRNFVEITESTHVIIDLKYASTDNFTHTNVYQNFNRVFLHKIAYEKFLIAKQLLIQKNKTYKFIIYDALRPRSAQYKLFDFVKGTPQESYIANPERGSMHNFGFALDISIANQQNIPLDMGTDFDDFSDLAQPKLEDKFFNSGQLSELQLMQRHFLRDIMNEAGFTQLPHEWWHFEALDRNLVRENYKIIE